MLGYIRLADVQGLFEIADALNAQDKVFQDFDADWVSNDFQKIGTFVDGDHTCTRNSMELYSIKAI